MENIEKSEAVFTLKAELSDISGRINLLKAELFELENTKAQLENVLASYGLAIEPAIKADQDHFATGD